MLTVTTRIYVNSRNYICINRTMYRITKLCMIYLCMEAFERSCFVHVHCIFVSCLAQGPRLCMRCKTCRDGFECVGRCPREKFIDEFGICQLCHPHCVTGCTGPVSSDAVRPERCDSLDARLQLTRRNCAARSSPRSSSFSLPRYISF